MYQIYDEGYIRENRAYSSSNFPQKKTIFLKKVLFDECRRAYSEPVHIIGTHMYLRHYCASLFAYATYTTLLDVHASSSEVFILVLSPTAQSVTHRS